MHKAASNRPRATIHILIHTPAREVHAPIMQRQGDVAHGMGQVQPNHTTLPSGCRGDRCQVEELTGIILDTYRSTYSTSSHSCKIRTYTYLLHIYV